ncbi:diguanylate cyclase [Pusillimonas sp. MFBS29]|uniref:diguanylate cyclase domain-containing protein n=1 Tax=Pusillimonas sp. MFBS29 TaxID=2886690 RepID=UPI001D12B1D8|nr:diguanylate cyclase [Pusillimonas sp. MFBS29]
MLEVGHKVAERLRLNFENYVFAKDHGGLKCTISLGVSVSEHYVMLVHAISRADEMLYLAKAQGRNRVVSTAPD